MTPPSTAPRWRTLRDRLTAFVLERHPFATDLVRDAFDAVVAAAGEADLTTDESRRSVDLHPEVEVEVELDGLSRGTDTARVRRHHALATVAPALLSAVLDRLERIDLEDLPDPTPDVAALERLASASEALLQDLEGFTRREEIRLSLDVTERRELLVGMLLTRAVDNRLKQFFLSGEVRWDGRSFQGKGFRSLGQEAIYGAALRLRRGGEWLGTDGRWQGDVVAPLIRDAGAALAMHPDLEMVRGILAAQMGKAGSPMDGRDLHVGDWRRGVLPPAAPLAISALTVAGVAWAMRSEGKGRVAVTFIGEGGTSLGEWHEAINACAVHQLPAIFCVENNLTALSTPVAEQSAARVFADKAIGYGVPAVTLDGTDPEAIAAAFAWAAERARDGRGPTLIELVALRMCGHAHHDDMLYLGKEPSVGWEYPELADGGYADADAWERWATRDPIERYADRLEAEGAIDADDVATWKAEAETLVETAARDVIAAPWPDPEALERGVVADGSPGAAPSRVEILGARPGADLPRGLPEVEPTDIGAAGGRTFLEAVMLGTGDALQADERVFVYGEDVGGDYGNAFLLLRPLLERF
ncbi:MAG: thiamine pyrophosphate-dependent enzyme, partial [Acidobacteriota bacterium]